MTVDGTVLCSVGRVVETQYLREEEEEEKKKEKKSGSNSTRDSETIANQEAGDPQVNLGALVVELAGLKLRR
ncbi:hypothetical protein Pmani_034222 [Petrolisthes manimaculis]|uniref:Uncharacterized protein n=1 Tax=Petrolisthes manimaculis TaxID=1843537 RepID=A0AAE1NPS1_9EUCA|nr:hypothetical protein Pmani_034222 [Petrolisthes manimaculis]